MSRQFARPYAGLFNLRTLFDQALDLLYPPCCERCGRVDTLWCDRCAAELARLPLDIVQRTLSPFAGLASTAPHHGVLRDAIHSLKYSGNPAIAAHLSARLTSLVSTLGWKPSACIPVPIHRERQRKRRYNQSELLAQGLSMSLGIPTLTEALQRERDTQPQVGLTSTERMRNVADAFRCATRFHGETLLLIDDVCTTGATLAACAEALLLAGAGQLYAVTVTAATISSFT
ncbi:MAG: ComF family protein [Anaerolineae bacterium]